jgi:hypothetical protein
MRCGLGGVGDEAGLCQRIDQSNDHGSLCLIQSRGQLVDGATAVE